ncbi:MAG: right-handed parallel beta-helix repeat-containing protein [Thermoplasmatota archaeon]
MRVPAASVLILFTLLASSCVVFFQDDLQDDTRSIIGASATGSPEMDHYASSSRSGSSPGIAVTMPVQIEEPGRYTGSIIHPNGAYYSFILTERDSIYLTAEVYDSKWDLRGAAESDIGILSVHSADMRFHLMDDGRISGLIWARNEDSNYDYYLAEITIGEDPEDIGISLNNFGTAFPEDPEIGSIRFADLEGGPVVCFADDSENLYYILDFKVDGSNGGSYISGEYPGENDFILMDFLSDGEFLYTIYQGPGGRIRMTTRDHDLSTVRERDLYTLPPGTGFDNYLYADMVDDELMIWLYIDQIRDYHYSSIRCLVFDTDGELKMDLGDPLERDGYRNSVLKPLIQGDDVFYLDDFDMRVYRMDAGGSMSFFMNATSIPYDQEITWMDVRTYTGGTDVVMRDSGGGYEYGFSLFEEGAIPELGIYQLDHELHLNEDELHYTTGIEITRNGSIGMDSSKLVLNSPFYDAQLVNRGKITAVDSEIIVREELVDWRYRDNDINEGRMEFIGSIADMRLENHGELLIRPADGSGGDAVDALESMVKLMDGTVIVEGALFSDMNYTGTGQTPIRMTGDRSSSDFGRLEFLNCTFRDVAGIISCNYCTVGFIGCDFMDTYQIAGSYSIDKIENCTFHNSTGLLMNMDGEFNVKDSSFNDCGDLFRSYGPDIGCIIERSRFNRVDEILLEGVETYYGLEDMSYLRVSECTFEGFDTALYVREKGSVMIENCSFIGGNQAVWIGDYVDMVDIRNNSFTRNDVSIFLAFFGLVDGPFTLRDNLFADNNGSILYFGHSEDGDTYFDPYFEEDILADYDSDLLDCRYNIFDSRNPASVAGTLSRDIYFLPYYTTDGKMITTDDDDLDGMDDGWEKRNGLDPSFYFDRYYDGDKDRFSNYQECLAGSDPGDQDDVPNDPLRTRFLILSILLIIIPISLVYAGAYYLYARRLNRELRFKEKLRRYGTARRSGSAEKRPEPAVSEDETGRSTGLPKVPSAPAESAGGDEVRSEGSTKRDDGEVLK